MTHMSATTDAFANSRPHKPSPSSSQSESTNSAIIRKIKEIYPTQTVPALAAWLSRVRSFSSCLSPSGSHGRLASLTRLFRPWRSSRTSPQQIERPFKPIWRSRARSVTPSGTPKVRAVIPQIEKWEEQTHEFERQENRCQPLYFDIHRNGGATSPFEHRSRRRNGLPPLPHEHGKSLSMVRRSHSP